MAASTSRSKFKSQKDGNDERVNDVISQGVHGYIEGYEILEKSEIAKRVRGFLNQVLLPLCMLVFTPQIVIFYWYTNVNCGGSYTKLFAMFRERSAVKVLSSIWGDISIVNSFTLGVVFGYCVWAVFWMKVLPGDTINGPVTRKGNTPVYTNNGFLHYLVTMVGFTVLTMILKICGMTPTVVYDRFGELLAFMNLFALVFVFILYLKGIYFSTSTDSGRTGGGFIFDYYWGTELHPRILGIDVKVFTNCRFGMTIWPLLVCIYTLKSYELHGFVDSMWVTTVLQLVYITKFFTWEAGYMQTIDIIMDRAGYYICWGCLCWLPALYPLVSQYLVNHPIKLGTTWSLTIFGLGLVSILVNYLADLQRQVVRSANGECLVWGRRPDIIRAKYTIENGEERENILLASGWWGLSRHFHYIPEILLSFFWTVTTGFTNLLPYTYVLVLVILLTHRSYRDENKCNQKYGKYWQQYCAKVKHRIIPYLF